MASQRAQQPAKGTIDRERIVTHITENSRLPHTCIRKKIDSIIRQVRFVEAYSPKVNFVASVGAGLAL